MAISRKDYEASARIISEARQYSRPACYMIALGLADYFATDNPAFDRARFLAACGLTDDDRSADCRYCLDTGIIGRQWSRRIYCDCDSGRNAQRKGGAD